MKKSKRKLQIGFDARMIAYRQAGGIGQYSLALLSELALLQAEQADFELIVYQSRKEKRPLSDWLKPSVEVKKRTLWTPPHHRWEQVALPLELFWGGLDVLHSPDFIPPFQRLRPNLQTTKSVITIHDLAFKHFPYLLTADSAEYYQQVKQAAHSAERIIAVSHSTARDIIEELEVSPAKVKVIAEAAKPMYRPLELNELKPTPRLENLKDNFLLFVGTIEPRKNLPVLLRAYQQAFGNDEAKPKLVIAGREGWLYQETYKVANELGLQSDLIWLGEVSDDELLYLYNQAALLAMPSLYEGFGLPPLEALACGCPVIVSDNSSLPETVGTLGTKLAPDDLQGWAGALQAGWRNRNEIKAIVLKDGPTWAATFSWRKAALETLKVYFEVI